MIDALNSAISGLKTNKTKVNVTANNIANLNTAGYKEKSVSVSSLSGQGNITQGSFVNSVSPLMSQGPLLNSGNSLDLAIEGKGFFIVKDGNGRSLYTRAGDFSMDREGYIVNPDGYRVQGFQANGAGGFTGNTGDLNASSSLSQPAQTANVSLSLNLDSSAQRVNGNFSNVNNRPQNYNFSTSLTVYDSEGASHDINAYFTKTGDNAWEVNFASEDASGNLMQAQGSQTLTFDQQGALVSDNQGPVSFDFGQGVANPQNITFDFGAGLSQGGTGAEGTTQYSGDFQLLNVDQDGNGAGAFESISIGSDGVITGTFSNGQTEEIGRLALANFNAPQELVSEGRNLFSASAESGEAIVGSPGTGGLGSLNSGAIESSNVDLAAQMINLITAENAFKANIKTVATEDELMNDLLNLKR